MKWILRIIFVSVLLSTIIIISVYDTVHAKEYDLNTIISMVKSSTEKISVSVNELDYVEKIRSYSEDELLYMGCSKEEVFYIKNYDYNKELLHVLFNISKLPLMSFMN